MQTTTPITTAVIVSELSAVEWEDNGAHGYAREFMVAGGRIYFSDYDDAWVMEGDGWYQPLHTVADLREALAVEATTA